MATRSDPSKQRRFDPSMSRRTRKATDVSQEEPQPEEATDGFRRMSLQELMSEGADQGINSAAAAVRKLMTDASSDQEDAAAATSNDEWEKTHLIVPKQGGVRAHGMLNRYVNVLNNLIKPRRNSKKKARPLPTPPSTSRVPIRNYTTGEVVHTEEAVTDKAGTYQVAVRDDHQEDTCKMILANSPRGDFSENTAPLSSSPLTTSGSPAACAKDKPLASCGPVAHAECSRCRPFDIYATKH
ncbi:hypothetical protein BHE74_00009931 [Ensete ventricosum]|nr:hypothetical protein BHE74_00009931 [Ensete ventricosum]RZR84537.1 hypothetical protein BHM03_00011388 [Ensete ventricosum]